MSIYERIDPSFFVAHTTSPTNNGLVLHIRDKKWTFHIPKLPVPCRDNSGYCIRHLENIASSLHRQPRPFAGTRNEHAQTVCVLQANWGTIVSALLRQPSPKNIRQLACFTDILMGPAIDGSYKQIDVIGDTTAGDVLVVEVGTNRKTNQLLEQLDVCRDALGDVPVRGLLAYYSFNRDARTVRVSIPEIPQYR